MTADLPLAAPRMAFHQRHPSPGLMHHSDRGSQYASQVYQHAVQGMQMTCSMSKQGNCFDKAVVESFFASLKWEECDGAAYPTRDVTRQHVFASLEQFYNRKRRRSCLGYVNPADFDAQYPAGLRRVAGPELRSRSASAHLVRIPPDVLFVWALGRVETARQNS